MAEITFRGNPIHTVGELPAVGTPAPAFTLTGGTLGDVTLGDFAGKSLVINIFPSIDTGVCAASVRAFNQKAGGRDDVTVLNVSADLPFAQSRFCGAEGIEGVTNASVFRSDFGQTYGVTMSEGPLAGLLARAVVIVDGDGVVSYTEQVPEIGQEPNYDAALAALG
jgi:thiol peroxidase